MSQYRSCEWCGNSALLGARRFGFIEEGTRYVTVDTLLICKTCDTRLHTDYPISFDVPPGVGRVIPRRVQCQMPKPISGVPVESSSFGEPK